MDDAVARRGPRQKSRGQIYAKEYLCNQCHPFALDNKHNGSGPQKNVPPMSRRSVEACSGYRPRRACINSHLKDLTPTCQTILVRAAAIGKACRGDVRKICAGVKPGGGRIEACIQSHLTELSASCQFDITRAFHAD